ncbi:ABC transporter substrate-binding protein [Patulibacter sp. SYSU D01012]|uniref:ABC transporter substrate-binding protein n=1 Tax=Patulibacter sp. SYSU D01012 TaxID=2817381 RepID=UPI001B313839|nr:ABC transporter substrate-binding protein [Patulibacter sp. SYSU D01012]
MLRPARRTAVLVPLALASSAVLAACGGSGGGTTTALDPSDDALFPKALPVATADVPALHWAVQAEPGTLDPVLSSDSALTQTVTNVLETLVRAAPNGRIEPALAERVDTPDPRTRVFTLRRGVRFHDGDAFGPEDVVASLRRAADGDAGSIWSSAFRSVRSVRATGPHQVTVRLARPDVLFDGYLATTAGAIESASFLRKAGRDYGSPSVGIDGTGPYRFAAWRQGQAIELERAPGYWDARLRPRAARVRVDFLPDASARINALRSGAVDGSFEIDGSAYRTLTRSTAGRLVLHPGVNAYQLVPLNDRSALRDPRVRRALSLALDRPGLNTAAWGGVGTVGRGQAALGLWQALVPDGKARWAQAPPLDHDVAQAKRLVQAAGATGKRIVLTYHTTFQLFPTVATAVQAAGKEIGLDVALRPQPFAKAVAIWFNPKAREGYDLGIWPQVQQTSDPTEEFTGLTSGASQNVGGWKDAAYDRLVARARETADPAARADLLVRAQSILSRELPWIPLVEPTTRAFLKDGLTGVPVTQAPRSGYPWAALVGSGKDAR